MTGRPLGWNTSRQATLTHSAAEADEFLRGVRCGLGVPQDVCMRLPVPVIVIDGHDIELYADEASAVVEIEGFYADDVVVLGADGTVY